MLKRNLAWQVFSYNETSATESGTLIVHSSGDTWDESLQNQLQLCVAYVARVSPESVELLLRGDVRDLSARKLSDSVKQLTRIEAVIAVEELAAIPITCTNTAACNFGVDTSKLFIASTGSSTDFCIYPKGYPNAVVDCFGRCVVAVDCLGVCAGTAKTDVCGVCDGDGSSCRGCRDSSACNYKPSATQDGSCTFPVDDSVDCFGNCRVDVDCSGKCGGAATQDSCGVCGGDGTACKQCQTDCKGVCEGPAKRDKCGVCEGDGSSCRGCTNSAACNFDRKAVVHDETICTYPATNLVDCNGNCVVEYDCAGKCGGAAVRDFCGVCEGDNSSCRPSMKSATFSSKGDTILLVFSVPTRKVFITGTDDTGNTNAFCASVFEDPTDALGGASCVWLDPLTVQIVLGHQATVIPTKQRICAQDGTHQLSQLQLRPGIVPSAVSSKVVNLAGCISINPPLDPIRPFVFVQHSPLVGDCEDVVFDASSMVSLAGSRPLQYSWHLDVLGNETDPELQLLNSPIPIIFHDSILTVPKETIPASATALKAQLTATTFLGSSNDPNSGIFVTTRTHKTLPQVQLRHPPYVRRSKTIRITIDASLPASSCQQVPSSGNAFAFAWWIRGNPTQPWQDILALLQREEDQPTDAVRPNGISFDDKRRSVLVLSPFTLRPCSNIEINATVTYSAPGFSESVQNWQSGALKLEHGAVRAVIDSLDVSVNTVMPLRLSAGKSFDEDALPGVKLQYVWTCTTQTAEDGRCGISAELIRWDTSVLKIPPNTMHEGTKYVFTVTVVSDAHPVHSCYPVKPRSDSDSVVVTAVATPVPQVSMQVCAQAMCQDPDLAPIVKGIAVVNYKPLHPVYVRLAASMDSGPVEGGISCSSELTTKWSHTANLGSDAVNTPSLLESHVLPTMDGFELMKFTPTLSDMVDQVYTFDISVSTVCKTESYASTITVNQQVDVRLNSPPRIGELKIEFENKPLPTKVVLDDKPRAVTTVFKLSHSRSWVDQQPPFKYNFGYVVGPIVDGSQKLGKAGEMRVNDVFYLTPTPGDVDSLVTTVPVPGRCGDRLMTIVVEATDSLGASSSCGDGQNNQCSTITVHKFGGTQADLIDILKTTVAGADTGVSSSSDVLQAVMAVQKAYGVECLQCGDHGVLRGDGVACICDSGYFGKQCDVQEGWTEWTPWSACTKNCDSGERSRRRTCLFDNSTDVALACPGGESSNSQTVACNTDPCVSEWSEWSDCSVACTSGRAGVFYGSQDRANNKGVEDRYCTVECPVTCPGDGCSGHGTCVLTPPACTDPSTCSAVCSCEHPFTGVACDLDPNSIVYVRQVNDELLNAVWTSLDGMLGEPSCSILTNALTTIIDIIGDDLDRLFPHQHNETLMRVQEIMSIAPKCIFQLSADITRLINLVPVFVSARQEESSAPNKSTTNTISTSSTTNPISTPSNTTQNLRALLAMLRDVRGISTKLVDNTVKSQVPNEPPLEFVSGGSSRITSVGRIDKPFRACSEDQTFCAIYPKDSVVCGDDEMRLEMTSVRYRTSINVKPPSPMTMLRVN